ncbi:MAG: DUF4105 domain-containing protein [Candidatus Eisenbacteria bacterium]|nr:DUF4105 domain-containing protein [Candidatus Eisenbacteria bacterium]
MRSEVGSARTILKLRVLPLLFLVPAVTILAASSAAGSEESYRSALLEEAFRAELHRDPYWHTLLHYKKGTFGGRSLVDDPDFFLAENGKREPKAEMEATIRSLFMPAADGERHPVCRFPARFEWLKERLSIDESRLPVPACAPFEELMERIRPESVTLIFPTSYMNSPASMYGHTLLTVRTAYASDLLSYAINYSAITDETFGLFYIAKGLLGLYEGYFSILPYYAKLQEYRDVNDRDIWEYSLNLDGDEVRRLLLHMYELQDIYSDYFFFSENCSYNLLFLLDAARPGLRLTDECAWWVIPLDTIREIKKAGLIGEIVYRPSKSTRVKHLASSLPPDRRKDALEIARGALEPDRFAAQEFPADEKIRTVDLAAEYLQYQYSKKELPKEQYVGRFLGALEARSSLGEAEEPRDSIPPPGRPDEGHRSNRIAAGFGFVEDRPFQEIRLRPAYHALIDNASGYKRGSQIVFLDAAIRYRMLDRKLELESIDLIDIVSIAPRDAFFKPVSWKVKTDLFRRRLENGGEHLVYRLNPGFGRAYENRVLGLWYLMLETDLHVGGALERSWSVGAGGSTGLFKDATGWWNLHLFAKDLYHRLGDRDNLFSAGLEQNFRIGADTSVSLEVLVNSLHDEAVLESAARWNVFF